LVQAGTAARTISPSAPVLRNRFISQFSLVKHEDNQSAGEAFRPGVSIPSIAELR
jgi:hypothetical protein